MPDSNALEALTQALKKLPGCLNANVNTASKDNVYIPC